MKWISILYSDTIETLKHHIFLVKPYRFRIIKSFTGALIFESLPVVSTMSDDNTSSSKAIPIQNLAIALAGPLALVVLSKYLNLKIETKIIVSVVRTTGQLLIAGYLLLSFIFSEKNLGIVLGYLALMCLVAAAEVVARQTRSYMGHFRDAVASVVIGGACVGIFSSAIVFSPDPWWNPRVLIPTSGMIIGSAVSGPALAVDRLLADISDKKHEPETRLSFGATRFECVLPTVRSALLAALLPNLNQMAVVGLVSIPGMMAGQLLGGTSPLVAAEYQMAILWLIFVTAGVSTIVGLTLCITHSVADASHRLTPELIIKKKSGGKVGFDVMIARWIIKNLKSCYNSISNCLCKSRDRSPSLALATTEHNPVE